MPNGVAAGGHRGAAALSLEGHRLCGMIVLAVRCAHRHMPEGIAESLHICAAEHSTAAQQPQPGGALRAQLVTHLECCVVDLHSSSGTAAGVSCAAAACATAGKSGVAAVMYMRVDMRLTAAQEAAITAQLHEPLVPHRPPSSLAWLLLTSMLA
jgi:hypothetical protein